MFLYATFDIILLYYFLLSFFISTFEHFQISFWADCCRLVGATSPYNQMFSNKEVVRRYVSVITAETWHIVSRRRVVFVSRLLCNVENWGPDLWSWSRRENWKWLLGVKKVQRWRQLKSWSWSGQWGRLPSCCCAGTSWGNLQARRWSPRGCRRRTPEPPDCCPIKNFHLRCLLPTWPVETAPPHIR